MVDFFLFPYNPNPLLKREKNIYIVGFVILLSSLLLYWGHDCLFGDQSLLIDMQWHSKNFIRQMSISIRQTTSLLYRLSSTQFVFNIFISKHHFLNANILIAQIFKPVDRCFVCLISFSLY